MKETLHLQILCNTLKENTSIYDENGRTCKILFVDDDIIREII